jgi:hypothetical protein
MVTAVGLCWMGSCGVYGISSDDDSVGTVHEVGAQGATVLETAIEIPIGIRS